MPIDHIDTWSDFGLAGLVIAALFAFVLFLIREHRAERSEWLTAYKEQAVNANVVQQDTNIVIRELTAVIRESNARRRGSD